MKLTNKTMIELLGSLRRLDSDLDLSGQTRINLARNIRVVNEAAEDYTAAINAVNEQFEGELKNSKDHVKKVTEVLEAEIDVPLRTVTMNDLNLDTNKKITSVVLSGLFTIISDVASK